MSKAPATADQPPHFTGLIVFSQAPVYSGSLGNVSTVRGSLFDTLVVVLLRNEKMLRQGKVGRCSRCHEVMQD